MKKTGDYYTIKEEQMIINYKSTHRPISAVSKHPGSSNNLKLPSFTNNTFDLPSNTNSKGVGNQIEKEKLFEETMQLKIVINKLKKELSRLADKSKEKDIQLTLKDREIEGIIEDFDSPEYSQTPKDNNLIIRLKHQFKKLKRDYDEEYKQSILLKQNYKKTKMNELNIEQELLHQQFEQMTALYENSIKININHKKKLADYAQIKENLKSQNIIIESLKENITNTKETEDKLNKNIAELNSQSEKYTQTINKYIEDNVALQKEIDDLVNQRKKSFSFTKTKENCLKKISELESQLKYYKHQAKTSHKTLADLKSTKFILEQTNQRDKEEIIEDSKLIIANPSIQNDKTSNIDIQSIKLQQTLEESKKKEKYLEDKFNEYQEKIQQLIKENKESQQLQAEQSNSTVYELNNDNPFHSSDDTNDPLISKKMTSNQYNQFTYILFKNFEAKKVNKEIANERIIIPTFENNTPNDTLEVIVDKFQSNILNLLNCKNEIDKQKLELYLSAWVYNFEGDVNKVIESFLMLFSYFQVYSPEKEEKLCQRIMTKYKEKFELLKESISNSSKEYISLLDIKNVFDEKKYELKDKYIEFLFYKMKQFDDPSASLFDLKISKLDELLDPQSSPLSESVQEITEKEYEKYIKDSLTMIKKGINKYQKTFRQIIKESIVKLAKPVPFDAISIEALNDEMRKIHVYFSELQLSCMCAKYCTNAELRALNVEQIEMDLKKISEIDSNDDEAENENENEIELKMNHTD